MMYPNYFQSFGPEMGHVRDENKELKNRRNENEITVFGMKISYAKAFGIVFLILFLLLFFPGIGVSSSSVKNKNKASKESTSGLKSMNENNHI